MRALMVLALSFIIGSLSSSVAASEPAFTGVFQGTGRACSGEISILADKIEWISSYSSCKSARYKVLERRGGDREQIALLLEERNGQCRYPVVELEKNGSYSWEVSGYQSLEAFQKRDLPDWNNSPLPERQVLSCPMIQLD